MKITYFHPAKIQKQTPPQVRGAWEKNQDTNSYKVSFEPVILQLAVFIQYLYKC